MQIYHLTISVRGRRTLARTETERRAMLKVVVSIARERLLLFSVTDDHVHTMVRSDCIGLLARDLCGALERRRPDLELKRPDVEPVGTRTYLWGLVRYFVAQPSRHALPGHPALFSGSCFTDLVGARLLPGFAPSRLLGELPRFRLRDLFPVVGLDPTPLAPASDATLLTLGPGPLCDLVASVFATPPDLIGRSDTLTRARTLAATLTRRLGKRLSDLADHLRVSRQAVSALSQRFVDPAWELALRRRLALEERARTDGGNRARSG